MSSSGGSCALLPSGWVPTGEAAFGSCFLCESAAATHACKPCAGLSVHRWRAKTRESWWGKEMGIANSRSNAARVFIRADPQPGGKLQTSGTDGCRGTAGAGEELPSGFAGERTPLKLPKKEQMREGGGGTYLRARWSWKPNWAFVADFPLQKSENRGEK